MQHTKNYSLSKVKSLPFLGLLIPAIKDPSGMAIDLSQNNGDIILFNVMGHKVMQVNHPDLVKRIFIENQKNYKKNKAYIRFEPAIGLGLLTSNGDKWKRDRQKIQPMFNRERISGYYFDIVNMVSEKYKKRWFKLTEGGKVRINITEEMAKITTEVILRAIFGKNITDETVISLHNSYSVLIEYVKNIRILHSVDLRKLFYMPAYFRFRRELKNIDDRLSSLIEEHRLNKSQDNKNLLNLLLEAQKQDPENFTDKDIRDHAVSMVFAGFESTSILMQWIWYVLDDYAQVKDKLRDDIVRHAPCTKTEDSGELTFAEIQNMEYMPLVLKETMRLYPPFWMTGREAIEDDYFGDFKVEKGTNIVISQLAMHRHHKFWNDPNSFIPERFLPENESKIDDGIYFPFLHGGRKCSGYMFVDMEAKTIIAKLLPLFNVTALNKMNNRLNPGISLKLKKPLMVEIERLSKRNDNLP
ncbi:MAG: cytochrome P450 [Rickettsiales bacterium]